MQPMVNLALRAARNAGKVIVRAIEQLDKVEVQAKGTNDLIIKNKEDRDVIAARVTEKMAGIKDMINKITGGLDEIGF